MPADTDATPATPVTPRPAASLVILKGQPDTLEVLLGRRPRASRFMPGVYVFPGGAVEKEDIETSQGMNLHPEVARRLEGHGGDHSPSTLAWAAIRETWEETGVLVGRKGTFTSLPSHPAAEAFRDAGLVPDLESLDYIVRAITPANMPIRFDARFFLADGERIGGQIIQNDELEEIGWYSLDAALGDEMPLRGVTRFVLEEARRRRPSPQGVGSVPVLTRRNGKRVIKNE